MCGTTFFRSGVVTVALLLFPEVIPYWRPCVAECPQLGLQAVSLCSLFWVLVSAVKRGSRAYGSYLAVLPWWKDTSAGDFVRPNTQPKIPRRKLTIRSRTFVGYSGQATENSALFCPCSCMNLQGTALISRWSARNVHPWQYRLDYHYKWRSHRPLRRAWPLPTQQVD